MKINRKETVIITCCPFCDHLNMVAVNEEDFVKWDEEKVPTVQAFPYLSADDREKLITGICPKCWAKLM